MMAGVTLINPNSITIDDTVSIAPDVIIEPHSHLRGASVIGKGSRIGPGSLIENSEIGENVSVLYSVINNSKVASDCRIGPYTHLRGEAQIETGCRIGNFVEVKKTTIGSKSNVAHLAYLGDAILGDRVNVGAGAKILGKVKLGNDVNIGANAVVLSDIGPGQTAVGIPAKILTVSQKTAIARRG
jgi:bifunctional UDP-N-acetylglucosamine pyrophosphorylase/glucosamine-1-phosphate N-acetyltransferase